MEFLEKNCIGLVLRAFSPKPELVDKTVRQLLDVVRAAKSLEVNGAAVFSRIDVMIATDRRYVDFDCGLTATALRQRATSDLFEVTEGKEGDLYCGLLNAGFYNQIRAGIDYPMNPSPGGAS